MTELKLCPFCGGEAKIYSGGVYCSNYLCFLNKDTINIHTDDWNNRHSEYNLYVEIAKLKAKLEVATDWEALRMFYNTYTHSTLNPEFAELMAYAYAELLERGVK